MTENEIKQRLNKIDEESKRSIRAIYSGNSTAQDVVELRKLDKEAKSLRDELHYIIFQKKQEQ